MHCIIPFFVLIYMAIQKRGIMATEADKLKWEQHNIKLRQQLTWGLSKGYVAPYDDKLIKKLRTIYSGGIPASIMLLSNGMSNGFCYDRALLLARAFLDEEDDVQLVYADIDSIRLNPTYIGDDGSNEHCFVERTTKDGQHIIYDTSTGLAYDKDLYWEMEHPTVNTVSSKDKIRERASLEDYYYPENLEVGKYAAPLIIPLIESTYGRPTEMYTKLGIELLQREIEHYKEAIGYEDVRQEVEDDMKRMGLKTRI